MTNTEFKEIRTNEGLSRVEFGEKLGLSKDQVAAREQGKTKITDELAQKVIDTFKKEEVVEEQEVVNMEKYTKNGRPKIVERKNIPLLTENYYFKHRPKIGVDAIIIYTKAHIFDDDYAEVLKCLYDNYPEHVMYRLNDFPKKAREIVNGFINNKVA